MIAGATAGPLDGAPGGHALRLPGGGASATVGAPGDLNFGTGGLSIAVWVRTTMRGFGRIVTKGSFGWTPGYFLSVGHGGDGHLGFGVGGGASWGAGGSIETTTAQALVNDGGWHHVCATYDGDAGEVRLYVDGLARPLQARGGTDGRVFGDILRVRDTTPAIGSSPLALTVGSHLGRQEVFVGDLADLRLFGRGLAPGAVAALARR
ncbi:MAG: hypothetical protein GEU96_08890 [Propionibacteriales bacterium]|nr:hypothetical protein [Propionibacteriales bacterium]